MSESESQQPEELDPGQAPNEPPPAETEAPSALEETPPAEEAPAPEAEAPAGPASLSPRAAEVFHGLWASVFSPGRAQRKTVLVCTANRWEGATSVACGLALAGSEPSGIVHVALVDFNLRHPAMHHLMGVNRGPGVTEAILQGMDPSAVAQPVNPNLDVLAAGEMGPQAGEALRSPNLPPFVEQLAAKYDHVLFDVAAVNLYPDAQILAGVLKEVLLVIRTEQTPREAIAQATKTLENGGAKLVGLVLNMRTFPIPRFLYRRV